MPIFNNKYYMPTHKGIKYYKYIPWEQVVYTGSSTWGNISASSSYLTQPAWHISNGLYSSDGDEWALNAGVFSGNLTWTFGSPLIIRGMTIVNRGVIETYGGVMTLSVYGIEADSTQTLIKTVTLPEISWGQTVITLPTPTWYYGLYFTISGTKQASGLGEVILNAATGITAGTADDYDFYKEEDKYYTPFVSRNYYYDFESWTQPVFTSNTTWGTLTASFEDTVGERYCWHVLDNDSSSYWSGDNSKTGWWQWEFAEKLKLNTIQFKNRDQYGGGSQTIQIYGINRDGSRTLIGTATLPNTPYADSSVVTLDGNVYYGLYLKITGTANYVGISNLSLSADKLIPASEDDYDYTETIERYYI